MSEGNGHAPDIATKTGASGTLVGGKYPPPVETRFQPGISGNPGGMPKGTKTKRRLRRALLRYLKAHPDAVDDVAGSLVEEAFTRPETIVEGDGKDRVSRSVGQSWAQAQKIIWDRLDGTLEKKIDIRARAIVKVLVRGDTESP